MRAPSPPLGLSLPYSSAVAALLLSSLFFLLRSWRRRALSAPPYFPLPLRTRLYGLEISYFTGKVQSYLNYYSDGRTKH